jgi:hypothetical protein
MEESRKQFETEMAKLGDCVDMRRAKNGDEEYMAWDVGLAWRFWNLSRAAIEVDLAPANLLKCDGRDVVEILKHHGIKVKE